jgi:uncharacterized protein YgfB (UPF0149 family)
MVKPHLLYRPSQYNASLYPDPYVKFFLFDRVICARDSGAVPLGWKGTVIGVHGGATNDPLFEVLFDEPFLGGMTLRCSPNQAYKMSPSSLINISHGMRRQAEENRKILDQGQPKPHTERQPSNQSRHKQQAVVQVYRPSRPQQTSGSQSKKPKNAVETNEMSVSPMKVSSPVKLTVLARSSEKSAMSDEFNQVMQELKNNSETGQQIQEDGKLIDFNQPTTQDGVLVDINGEEELNCDWVKTDLALLGVDESENTSVSDDMKAAIQGLSELGVNELNALPLSMDGGENEDDVTEVVEDESVVEAENANKKSAGNEAQDPTEVLKRILNVSGSTSQPVTSVPSVPVQRPVVSTGGCLSVRILSPTGLKLNKCYV